MDTKRKSPRKRKEKGHKSKVSGEDDRFEAIAEGIKSLERTAFIEFAESLGPILRSHFIKKRNVPVVVAEEVADICIIEIPCRTQAHYKRGNYLAWVYRVADNLLNDYLRENWLSLAMTVPIRIEKMIHGYLTDELRMPVTSLMEQIEQECIIPDLTADSDIEPDRDVLQISEWRSETAYGDNEQDEELLDPNVEHPHRGNELVNAVRDAVKELSERERSIVERFDLSENENKNTLKGIARSRGIEHENARKIHSRALKKLERILEADPRIRNHPRIGQLLGQHIPTSEKKRKAL